MFYREYNYAFATQLYYSCFTIGNITSFFNNPKLRPLHKNLSYRSAKKQRDLLSSILFSLQDNKQKIKDISITSTIPRLLKGVHYIFYQNVVGLIAFILSYCLFASKIAYAPICTFNNNFNKPKQMYYKLHSANQQQETQAQLLLGAIVILVIILVDKTQLSMH